MLLQKLRLQRRWSQQQLAELSDLSVRTIQRIEQGKGASTESLKSLAAVFEIDLSTLQMGSDMSTLTSQGYPTDEVLAFRHVRKLKRFYLHLVLYVLVIGFLAAINMTHNPTHIWFVWPALGWGFAIIIRALTLFDLFPFFGADWERQQVEKRLGRKL